MMNSFLHARKNVIVFVVIMLFFAVLAVVFTRPVFLKASDSAVEHVSDPPFQAWTLAWDNHELVRNPFNLFNANIFYPNRYTLAYSDHQIVTALLSAPVLAITGNPMQTANYMLVFEFFLCSLGAYLLTVHLTKNRFSGVIAGIAYAYAPYKLSHIVHLNLCTAGFIPLTFLFLHMYVEKGKPRNAALAALFFVLQALSTWHYGLILAVGILLFLVVRLITNRKIFTLKWTAVLAISFIIALALILPFALPYFKVQKTEPKFQREAREIDTFTADVQDFLVAPQENLIWGKLTKSLRDDTLERGDKAGPTERSIFPGLIPLVLGLIGAFYLFLRGEGEERFYRWFYVSLLVLSAVLCLGNTLFLCGNKTGIPMPYRIFYYLFPGFKAMRVPPRFSIMVALALAVLSGFAVKAIINWIKSKRGMNLAFVASLVLLILLLVDLMSVSMPMQPIQKKKDFPAVYSWLSKQEGETPMVELPIPLLQNSETWAKLDTMRTYYSTSHWKKMMNGYSGYLPGSLYDAAIYSMEFPSREGIDYFKKVGLEYIIVHTEELDTATIRKLHEWDLTHKDINLMKIFSSDEVYKLEKGSSAGKGN